MKAITEVSTIIPNKPDDILISTISFEDRCLGALRRMVGYHANQIFLLDFLSKVKQEEGETRRKMNAEEMKSILYPLDRSKFPEILKVRPYDPLDMAVALDYALKQRKVDIRKANITLDISCFTKVQLFYMIRRLLDGIEDGILRIIYTLPHRYNTERRVGQLTYEYSSPLYFGVCRPRAPISSRAKKESIAVIMLGHEGSRLLLAWSDFAPDSTKVIRANSGDPDVMATAEDNNPFFFTQIDRGDPSFEKYDCNSTSVEECRNVLAQLFSQFDSPDMDVRWGIVPMGPKPFVVSIAILAAEGCAGWVDLIYPTPLMYDAYYSEGIRNTFSDTIKVRKVAGRTHCIIE